MPNHNPVFTSSSATGNFTETANTSDSMVLHELSGTMNFTDSDRSDSHTTSVALKSAVVSGSTVIPASILAHFQTAMTSQITSDSNGSGKLKWSFSDADDDFDFLSKNQTIVLTYDIKVSDNHGGFTTQTVKITVTGTDDKPVISAAAIATVTEQADKTLSLSPDIAHVTLNFVDQDIANTGHTATVTGVSATGNTSGLLPGSFGTAELMSFFEVDGVVKNAGSSTGTINTTFAAADLAFDYLAAGQFIDITYTVRLDDNAGGISTQNVVVRVIGTNDKPFYLCGPETRNLTEGQDVNPSGNLTAQGDLLFSDVDLSDTHTVSTTVTASRSGGGAIPIPNAALLAAFNASLGPDSTGHIFGEVDWNFAFADSAAGFLNAGETLTLVYHVTVQDGSGGSDIQDVTIKILGTNHPVIITSGPQSSTVSEQADTTGSAAIDTTPTTPAGMLAFTDSDTSDAHTVAVTLASTSGPAAPAATQTDLASALTTILHDSTGTGSGSIDWNFAVPDQDLDYLAAGETLTVSYNVKVSDGSTSSTQTVSVDITGANDAVAMTSGPGSASLSEQAGVTGSASLDTTSPDPTGTLTYADVDVSDVHSVGVIVSSAITSDGSLVPDGTLLDLQAALLTTLHDSTGTGAGGVDWSFAIQDKDLDFLAAGQTLTITYDVTVFDGFTSSTQQVTVTATGAEDPLIVNPAVAEVFDTSGTDAGNFLVVGNAITDAEDSSGDIGVSLSVSDINGVASNVGSFVAGTYGSLLMFSDGTYLYQANANVDPLQVGDHVVDQFNFTVMDSLGRSQTTTLTLNVNGADDAAAITGGALSGVLTEDAGPTVAANGGFETGSLSGWISSGVTVGAFFIGGAYGDYTAQLHNGFLEQDVTTVAGQHYTLSFTVAGDGEASATGLNVYWDGIQILAQTNVALGFAQYTFDVIGDALDPTTQLFFDFSGDGSGILLDQVSIAPTPGPAVEAAAGNITFSDIEVADTHTASFTSDFAGYVGTFTLDPVSESGGTGSVGWHYSVNNADIQFLAQGQTLVQTYSVGITGNHGAPAYQTVTVAINGVNDAPTAIGETVITDVGANGVVDIQPWMLAANDADPDKADDLFVNAIGSSTGGTAVGFGDAFFIDDATPGGSFQYTTSDGIATGNFATATIVNNATSATTLTGTAGDDIIIATNGTETLSGGGGNDILVGNAGSHVMSGGSGYDTFAFLQTNDGPGIITDFNNTSEHDHIAISASGFGGGLTAGMDVSSLFETSGDDQFGGLGAVFHFDTANQTLYFSADGTQASAITVAAVQAGVTLNPHDLLIV
ncbi:MAG: VCBS domain-containing protein [bacterium]|nr:VCBS domain-containing protein [bacterium]